MALSYKLNNLEGVDDALKGLYNQVNGVFFLDVDGVESAESVEGLKNALQAQKDTVTALKQQEIDATTAAAAAEQARLLEAGKHEELAAKVRRRKWTASESGNGCSPQDMDEDAADWEEEDEEEDE